jgi:hypothetical protein
MSPMKVLPPDRGGISNLDWHSGKCLKDAILKIVEKCLNGLKLGVDRLGMVCLTC